MKDAFPDGVQPYVEAHERFAQRAAAPAWLQQLRVNALARFRALGFPDTSHEAWRFTSVRPIAEGSYSPRTGPAAGLTLDDAGETLALAGGPRLVFVDGAFSRALSTPGGPSSGFRMQSLSEAIQEGSTVVRAQLERWTATDDPFAALGAAFIQDGAFLHVAAGTRLDEPLSVVYLSTGQGKQALFPQTIVSVDREADVTLNEVYASAGGGDYFTDANTTALIADGARLRHYRIQLEHSEAKHIAASHWALGRDAVLESCSIALGSSLARHQLVGVLGGPNGALTLDGLTVLSGTQHADHHTVIDHAKPHCESHEVFNGVFGGAARGVFNGRIIVRPGAQRTDSKQTSNNLLLSDQARADTQPQLEIYADDVKCTHGATLGPLDETAMFYLLSRGLGRDDARGALTYGFAAEILARVSDPGIRAELDRLVRRTLLETIRQAA